MLKEIVRNFAENCLLDTWDWVAVSIALVSFIVAVLSFRVAKKTLSSQRKTEKNTMPIITIEKQYEVLRAISKQLLDNYIDALSIMALIGPESKGKIYKKIKIPFLPINVEEIHVELFYSSESNTETETKLGRKTPYIEIYLLKGAFENYNRTLSVIFNHMMGTEMTDEGIFEEIKLYLLNQTFDLLGQLSKCVTSLYNNENAIHEVICLDLHMGLISYRLIPDYLSKAREEFGHKHIYMDMKAWSSFYKDKSSCLYIIGGMTGLINALIDTVIIQSKKLWID